MVRSKIYGLVIQGTIGALLTFTAVPVSHAQGVRAKAYRVDPKIRKKTAREYLIKSIELNTRVEAMIMQNVDNLGAMLTLLQKSYNLSAQVINQMEGIVREGRFPDPMMERAIRDMYTSGKPCSLQASAKLRDKKPEAAIHALEQGMITQRRVLQVLY